MEFYDEFNESLKKVLRLSKQTNTNKYDQSRDQSAWSTQMSL